MRLASWRSKRLCFNLPTQSFFQLRVPVAHRQISYGVGEGFGLTYQHADFLGSRNARIDKVALEHHEMGHQYGDDHDGVFRTLTLVDGGGIGQGQLIQLRGLVFYQMVFENHGDGAVFHTYLLHDSDVAVEYVLVVIIPYLHHAVALLVGGSATADTQGGCVERLLQHHVQIGCSHHASLHRREHLDIAQGLIVGLYK